jgi:phage terminase Nu1 subunit (DNA packaging protein)
MSETRRTMSQAEYARHRGKSRQYVSRLAARGILVVRGGRVDVAASDAVLDDKPVDVEPSPEATAARPAGDATQPAGSFAQAKTAEMIFRAKLRKLEYETRTGKFISADEVKVKWFQITRQIRDKLLGLPSKLAPQLAALNDMKEIRDLLDAEIAATLRSLQEDIRYSRR